MFLWLRLRRRTLPDLGSPGAPLGRQLLPCPWLSFRVSRGGGRHEEPQQKHALWRSGTSVSSEAGGAAPAVRARSGCPTPRDLVYPSLRHLALCVAELCHWRPWVPAGRNGKGTLKP